ncbi:hypothetical protein [Xanthomonas oryzae]|uniref:hypothetical protein n=1 Tax=Xanthomonas oryzae TaxID=347 RepID=UPI0006AC21DB|nr:hypothetical protein [Xanthomonas oryzae]QBG91094.1 plasmid mobilization protein [Xanthomonas oryzae]
MKPCNGCGLGVFQGRLNKEAELIEKWIEAQQEIAKQSLNLLRSIPGIQVEQCFQDAYGALLCKTAKNYTAKPLLFEDTEILARAMKRYACMMVRPHRARVAYLAAQAQLSEHSGSLNAPQAARAHRHYQRKKTLVSKRVLQIQERRLCVARQAMIEAHQALEANFVKDVPPVAVDPLGETDRPNVDVDRGLRLEIFRRRPRL